MHKAHSDPEAFRDFIIAKWGQEKFERMKRRAYEVKGVDHAMAYIALTNHKLTGMEAGT